MSLPQTTQVLNIPLPVEVPSALIVMGPLASHAQAMSNALSGPGARGEGLRGFGAWGRTWSGKSFQLTTVHGSYGAPTAAASGGGFSFPSWVAFGFPFGFIFPDPDVGAEERVPPGPGASGPRCAGWDAVLDGPVVDGGLPDVRGLSNAADAPGPLLSEAVTSEQPVSTTNSAVTALTTLPSRRIHTVCRLPRAVLMSRCRMASDVGWRAERTDG
jgi:hypothetical protein